MKVFNRKYLFLMVKINILFVCMGNICRSPTAEAVFKHYVVQAGLEQRIHSDSAGTHAYHIGEPPDARAQRHAAQRGYDLSALRARRVVSDDFVRFDVLLAMDEHNLSLLVRDCPQMHTEKLALFMQYSASGEAIAVPDPYYGGASGFERALNMAEDAAQGLLRHICVRYSL
jgi:protein-tyrosine phosphatase